MTKGFRLGVSSGLRSTYCYRRTAASSPAQERLNRMAREYYRHVYGRANLSRGWQLCRIAGAIILFLLAIAMWWKVASGSVFEPESWQFRPTLDCLYSATTMVYIFVVFTFWLQQRRASKTGCDSRQALRQFQAHCATAAIGGCRQFLTEVKLQYSRIPDLSAWYLAPYWADTGVLLGIAAVLGAGFLVVIAHFVWPRPIWESLLLERDGFVVLYTLLLNTILVVYFAMLVLLNMSDWEATHLGEMYFPLQVFCRDLEEIEELPVQLAKPSNCYPGKTQGSDST